MKIQFVNVTSVVWNEERLFELENGVTLHFLSLMIFERVIKLNLFQNAIFQQFSKTTYRSPEIKIVIPCHVHQLRTCKETQKKKKRWATQSDTNKKGSTISISNFASTNMFARVIAINQKQPSHTHTYIQAWSRKINRFAFFPLIQTLKTSWVRVFAYKFPFPLPFYQTHKVPSFSITSATRYVTLIERSRKCLPVVAHIYL